MRAALGSSHGHLHLHHVLLHGHLDLGVLGAEVHDGLLEVILLDACLREGLVGHLGLLNHHHDHHFHLVHFASSSCLLLHLHLLLGHLHHLLLGGLLQSLDVLHGLQLVDLGSFLSALVRLLKLTLLSHHDELLGLGVLHELLVSHLELLLVDAYDGDHLHQEFVTGLLFSHQHLSDDVGVEGHVLVFKGFSAEIDLLLALVFILFLDSRDNELEKL